MNNRRTITALLSLSLLSTNLIASELPYLPKDLDPKKQSYGEQPKLPDLREAYVSTSPKDLKDGLQVGRMDLPGTEEAVKALLADDKAGKYGDLDSILIWKDGKLLFEMYNRRGRVDGPHYTMSVTKTLTSVVLARAIQCGLVDMEDLDKPVISLISEIDRSRIQPGVETITLRDALFMKSGLRFSEKSIERKLGNAYQRQAYFQKLFELTAPVTAESKTYKYTGIDPSMVMMIIDIRAPGTVQKFIAKELAGKIGATYCWADQGCGIPKCGAGSNFTSRDLIKIGATVIQGGRFNGEQLLSAEYVKQIMDRKKGDGYFYYFHNRPQKAGDKKVYFISGIGAGGQYMATFPELNVVAVATAHNKGKIRLPLEAVLEHLVPLFTKRDAAESDGKYLFILSGQSNMQGMNQKLTFEPRVFEEFGEQNVLIVKEAIGGRPIRMWIHDWAPADDWKVDPNIPGTKPPTREENGVMYQSMMQKIATETKGAKPKAIAFCWMQGERDARERHSAVYERSLKKLFSQLKEDFPGIQMVFVIGKLSDFGKDNKQKFYPEWEEVCRAQEKVAADTPNCTIIGTDDLNTGASPPHWKTKKVTQRVDDLHMSADGYKILGLRFAEESIKLLQKVVPQ
ncbi:MAG: sialate O-acetylesterase [Planctomycetota bacterium]|jgi:CubicO group peptidase (beta-lactamase class C family)